MDIIEEFIALFSRVRTLKMEKFDINNLNEPHFVEIEGLIVTAPLKNQLEWLERLGSDNPDISSCELESFMNHSHPGLCNQLHENIRHELHEVEELTKKLKLAYPRFPEVEWGKCNECGSLMIAGRYELLTFIGNDEVVK